MKCRTLHIFISALVTSAFFLGLGFSVGQAQEEEFVNQEATVNSLTGKVEVFLAQKGLWEEAKVQMRLGEQDKIRTLADGKVELLLEDGSFVRLKPDSTLTIKTARQKLADNSTQYQLELRVGEIMLELQKLNQGSSFEVETPTAVAAVRGTTYYMRYGTREVNGEEKSFVEIFVDSGAVSYTSTVSGQSCILQPGEGAIVYDDGTIEGPFFIPPAARDAWREGWQMVTDEAGKKKGMRDADKTGGGSDLGDDVDDTTDDQSDSQDDALNDQNQEQDISGSAKQDGGTNGNGSGSGENGGNEEPLVITDIDNDGIDDAWEIETEDNYGSDYLNPDTDADGIDDFEDAFPNDATIDDLSALPQPTNIEHGYGSWEELRQAALDNLIREDLNGDIADMLDDIHAHGYEAAKENIFDHQAGKVMTDRWGNRVRVEAYISKPRNNQVQILSMNLRTAGPNAGISSLDFRVTFDDLSNVASLKSLPWSDYMHNPLVGEFEEENDVDVPYDDDAQLILYDTSPNNPLPIEFSLEVKNPYADSVKVTETYDREVNHISETNIWYQVQEGDSISITGRRGEKQYCNNDIWFERSWGQNDRYTFLRYYYKNWSYQSWLVGMFYLIDDEGKDLNDIEDGISDICGIRDWINPDHNLEIVLYSSEFTGHWFWKLTFPGAITLSKGRLSRGLDEFYYNRLRTIDVISIPEITTPYNNFKD